MTKDEAKDITYECQDIIQQDLRMQDLVDYLETEIEFPSFQFVERLGQELTYLSNNTRRWILKGHTPNEVSSAMRDSLPVSSPLPFDLPLPDSGKFPALNAPLASKNIKSTSGPANQTVDNIVSIKTGQKIGRNDPCPCGSGKKFKHCCGKG